jgi:hypothetical protein
MRKRSNAVAILGVIAGLMIATSTGAESPSLSGTRLIDALAQCRTITDPKSRLDCYDKASEIIVAARDKHDIVVVDREEVKQARKSLFGFTSPNLNLFGHNKDKASFPEEEIKQIEGVVETAQLLGDGNWSIILDNQAMWLQTDNQTIVNEPHKGSKIIIKRGALGAFWMIIERQPAIKVQRAG